MMMEMVCGIYVYFYLITSLMGDLEACRSRHCYSFDYLGCRVMALAFGMVMGMGKQVLFVLLELVNFARVYHVAITLETQIGCLGAVAVVTY